MERKNAWKTYNDSEKEQLQSLNADYIDFLSECKTERECIIFIKRLPQRIYGIYFHLGQTTREHK